MDDIIREYFEKGHRYLVISLLLLKFHGIRASQRSVKRCLKRLNLKRNGMGVSSHSPVLVEAIQQIQINTEGRAGYRRTWRLLNHRFNIRATQESVRIQLMRMNPEAVQQRISVSLVRRRYIASGPNHIWHSDGYDKLKPYGFAIHGCIDGFSRKILWLSCSVSNNDPRVVLHHYLETVRINKGCPVLLRTDCGTETVLLCAAQCTFRENRSAHLYGPSYRNQRIEAWWSVLRQSWSQIWIDTFDDLMSFGSYRPDDPVHRSIAEFCFMPIIRMELDEFVEDWNSHRIRKTRTSGCPGGIPNELFLVPEMNGFTDRIQDVDFTILPILMTKAKPPAASSNTEIEQLCDSLVRLNDWQSPTCRREAVAMYLKFINKIEA